MAALDPPPDGIDLNDDLRWTIIGPVIALVVLSTIAVVLRIMSRRILKLQLRWDDYLILAALVLTYGTGILSIISCHFGVGRHVWSPLVDLESAFKVLWAYEFVYITVVVVTKTSIIMFYHRIFAIPPYVYAFYFSAFLVATWWVSQFIVLIVQCRPYNYFWTQHTDLSAKGRCINLRAFFIASGTTGVATDFIILAVPIPIVLSLRLRTRKKVAVCGIFLLGSFACVAGVVRLYFLTEMFKSVDFTWSWTSSIIWGCVEPCIGIVSACLPIMAPIFYRYFPRWFKRSSTTSTVGTRTGTCSNSNAQKRESYCLQGVSRSHSHMEDIDQTNDIFTTLRTPENADGDAEAGSFAAKRS